MDTDDVTPPDSSEQILQETKEKELKQELDNTRIVKQNEIFDTNMEVSQRLIDHYESINIDGMFDDKIERLQDNKKDAEKEHLSVMRYYGQLSEDMPIIPMGKNTHDVNELGFKERTKRAYEKKRKGNKSKQIKMSKSLENEIRMADDQTNRSVSSTTAQVLAIRNAWNSLSDEQRDLIGTLQIAGEKGGGTVTSTGGSLAGQWSEQKKTMKIIVDKDSNFRTDTVQTKFTVVQHEVGHAEFHNLQKRSPKKTKKFVDTIMSMAKSGSSPITAYAGSYLDTDAITEKDWENKLKKNKEYFKAYTPKQISLQKETFKIMRDEWTNTIYANETHSALAEIVHGTSTRELAEDFTNKATGHESILQKYFKAYQELHET